MSDNNDHWCPPVTAGDIKKGDVVLLKDKPCKIMSIAVSKTGKHGHAKCNFTGIDVFTGKKINDVQPAHMGMRRANIVPVEYQLMDISEEKEGDTTKYVLSMLDDKNEVYDYAAKPEDTEELLKLKEAFATKAEDAEITVTLKSGPNINGADITIVEYLGSFKTGK